VDPKNPDAALKDKIDAWHKQGIRVARINWKYPGYFFFWSLEFAGIKGKSDR
jgi:hypothetical protein